MHNLQHMGSNKHRRIGALAGHRAARLPGKEGTGRRECNVREIPMLSMFLQVTFCEFCKISEMLKKVAQASKQYLIFSAAPPAPLLPSNQGDTSYYNHTAIAQFSVFFPAYSIL